MSDEALRKLAGWAVAIVATIAAVVSFQHIYLLSRDLGQPILASWLMPLSVDGTVGGSAVALLSAARTNEKARVAVTMLVFGILATLTANGYSGKGHGLPGVVLACWPAIAFIGTTEVALNMVRRAVRRPASIADGRGMTLNESRSVMGLTPYAEPPAATTEPPAATRPPMGSAWPDMTAEINLSPLEQARMILVDDPHISGARLASKINEGRRETDRISERTGRRILRLLDEQAA